MILRSTIYKTIPTIKGDRKAKIHAQLVTPLVDNLKREVSFQVKYFFIEQYTEVEKKEAEIIKDKNGNDFQLDAEQEAVTKERKIILFEFTETYNEKQVEDLYIQIKPYLVDVTGFFIQINKAIELAFEQNIKQGNFFGLKANKWEKLS